ncbi:D-alanyl-D-alanine carboxypeptidase family protein [Austwickia chelonae]|uniref:D-alanyl-D-alanine carboxypeptidase family protein n=1 Tax=Austwickia chelonae TaxID=100225 RepID=UPI000E24FB00|nr:D-alanyl-D-alanine carboxypeptidase family protein [Austwickia chelonae]
MPPTPDAGRRRAARRRVTRPPALAIITAVILACITTAGAAVPAPAATSPQVVLSSEDKLNSAELVTDLPKGVPAPPPIAAKSYLLAEMQTGKVLVAKNAHQPYLPASTMKLLTAQVLAPQIPDEQRIRTTLSDAQVDGTRVGMIPNREYTARELFQSLLMGSANDAAEALARTGPGGSPKTIEKMNERAGKLGTKNTVAKTPHGLDAPGQKTSAYDLVTILRGALENPKVAQILTMQRFTFPGDSGKPGFEVASQNKLLWNYPGALGGKDGFTDAAGHTYVGAVKRGNRTYAIAFMAARTNDWKPSAKLLDWAFAHGDKVGSVGSLPSPPEAKPTAPGQSPTAPSSNQPRTIAESPPPTTAGFALMDFSDPTTLIIAAASVIILLIVVLRIRKLRKDSRRQDTRKRRPSRVPDKRYDDYDDDGDRPARSSRRDSDSAPGRRGRADSRASAQGRRRSREDDEYDYEDPPTSRAGRRHDSELEPAGRRDRRGPGRRDSYDRAESGALGEVPQSRRDRRGPGRRDSYDRAESGALGEVPQSRRDRRGPGRRDSYDRAESGALDQTRDRPAPERPSSERRAPERPAPGRPAPTGPPPASSPELEDTSFMTRPEFGWDSPPGSPPPSSAPPAAPNGNAPSAGPAYGAAPLYGSPAQATPAPPATASAGSSGFDWNSLSSPSPAATPPAEPRRTPYDWAAEQSSTASATDSSSSPYTPSAYGSPYGSGSSNGYGSDTSYGSSASSSSSSAYGTSSTSSSYGTSSSDSPYGTAYGAGSGNGYSSEAAYGSSAPASPAPPATASAGSSSFDWNSPSSPSPAATPPAEARSVPYDWATDQNTSPDSRSHGYSAASPPTSSTPISSADQASSTRSMRRTPSSGDHFDWATPSPPPKAPPTQQNRYDRAVSEALPQHDGAPERGSNTYGFTIGERAPSGVPAEPERRDSYGGWSPSDSSSRSTGQEPYDQQDSITQTRAMRFPDQGADSMPPSRRDRRSPGQYDDDHAPQTRRERYGQEESRSSAKSRSRRHRS